MSLKGITIETAPEKEAHISAADDRAIWEALIGTDGVIEVGQKLRGELVTNNQFRIYDGALTVGGAIARIPFGEYEDVVIENGTQNQRRNDLVVVQIDANTSIEEMKIVYIKGVPGEAAEDPEYIAGNIYENATCRQYPLYRIKLNGLNVESVEPLFEVITGIKKMKEEIGQLNAKLTKSTNIRVRLNANSVSVDTTQIPEIKTTSTVIVQRNLSSYSPIYPIYSSCIEDGKLRIYFSASHTEKLSIDLYVLYSV